ncbi:MAG: Outer membrane protein assembly factor BamB [Phycisphaerae bacterium]|nr:Outer membrane protein assembly factor BamB [Phycisphaerae bacterium]
MSRTKWALCAATAGTILLAVCQLQGGDWPQWRGPNRDGRAADFKAADAWPKELTRKWQVSVGGGDASPVLAGGRLYVFARVGNDEVTLCLNAEDHKEIWRDRNPVAAIAGPAARAHSGPRSTPAVASGKVVTLGVSGVLSCLDAEKGTVVWRKDEIKGTPRFFTSSSPIIVDGMAVAQLGPETGGAIVAYALDDGKQKWTCPNQGSAYASPVLMTVDGVSQIVALTSKSVVSLAVADGQVLWEVPFAGSGRSYNAATPVVDGDMVIVSGSGRGTKALKVAKMQSGKLSATEAWTSPVAVQFCTPVLSGGRLYGVSEKGDLFCLNGSDGKTVWTDTGNLGGYSAMLAAGDAILALPDDGQLIVLKAGADKRTDLATYKVADRDTFACPAIAGDCIYVKDKDNLTCWSLK